MPESQNIADRFAAVMHDWHLSQTKLALALKVDTSYISRILKGERTNISERILERLEIIEKRGPLTSHVSEAPQNFAQSRRSNSPRELLKKLREEKGMSVAELAKATAYEIGYLQALEDGGARISESLAIKLCGVLGCEPDDLLGGSDHATILSDEGGLHGTVGKKPNIVLPEGMTGRYVPLISWAQAGTMKNFTDESYQYEGHVAFNVTDRRAFAVTVRGDSMAPIYGEGDVVILYPSAEPRNGDPVIARLDDQHGGDVMFKLFNATQQGKRVLLASYNPAFPALEYDRSDFSWIYPAASVVKNLRR